MSDSVYVYTLHKDEDDFRIEGSVLARSPQEAASVLGGEFVQVEGWPMGSSKNPDELNLVGKIRFAQALFRRFSAAELARIKLDYDPGSHYERGAGLNLWSNEGDDGKEFVVRRIFVTLPAYTRFA